MEIRIASFMKLSKTKYGKMSYVWLYIGFSIGVWYDACRGKMLETKLTSRSRYPVPSNGHRSLKSKIMCTIFPEKSGLVGRIKHSQKMSTAECKPVNLSLHGDRNFADVILLRTMWWRDYPGWLGWVRDSHKGAYKRGAGGSEPEKMRQQKQEPEWGRVTC